MPRPQYEKNYEMLHGTRLTWTVVLLLLITARVAHVDFFFFFLREHGVHLSGACVNEGDVNVDGLAPPMIPIKPPCSRTTPEQKESNQVVLCNLH